MNCNTCKSIIFTKQYKCPIDIIHTSVEVVHESLCKSVYVFTQPVAVMEIEDGMKIVAEQITYYENAVFCSENCLKFFLGENSENYLFTKSWPIFSRSRSINF